MNSKLTYLEEVSQYIPSASQTLSKNPRQYVIGVTPVAVTRAEGAYFWDIEGKRYLDLVMALGPFVFGYNFKPVDDAVKRQIDKGTIFSLAADVELELAKLLRQVVPCAEMSRFLSNGCDATGGAIRLARHVTGRDYVAKCGYHGCLDWSIANTSGRNTGVPQAVKELTLEFKYNDIGSLEALFKSHPNTIAAVILEPASHEPPHESFLEKVRDLARSHGAVFIFDEMVTGFRWALGGAQAYFGVTPDIGCFGKAVASGYPISIICGKSDLMKRMDEIFVSTTFGGFAPSVAAAIETIRQMQQQPDVHSYMHELGNVLIDQGNQIAKQHNLPIKFSGFGPHPFMTIALEDYAGRVVKSFLYQEMNKVGILFSSSIMISRAHSREEIDLVLQEFSRICAEISPYCGDFSKLSTKLTGEIVAPRTVRVIQ